MNAIGQLALYALRKFILTLRQFDCMLFQIGNQHISLYKGQNLRCTKKKDCHHSGSIFSQPFFRCVKLRVCSILVLAYYSLERVKHIFLKIIACSSSAAIFLFIKHFRKLYQTA
ncbi:hypothetical protein HZS_44 [Henneguya salminicola]|nr:hypothetical protein HZS_44 [Henneguya salminicola]